MPRLLLAVVALALAGGSASAQGAKVFEVRWFGQSFFQVVTPSGKRLVFDPHLIPFFGKPTVTADVILISHDHNDHTQIEAVEKGKDVKQFAGVKAEKPGKPGDWVKIDEKFKDMRVRTVGTYHDNEGGIKRGKNSIMIVEVDGLTFCHLGDLGEDLTDNEDKLKAMTKLIGKVDVLFVPVGGIYTINGEEARKLTKAINPRLFAIPMHFDPPNGPGDLQPVDEFLDEVKNVKKTQDTNLLTINADAKADGYTVQVLGYKENKEPDPKKDK
jgi:L-ascorbate metabolism protein UlaG (beta-lactamase superfamily)